MAIACMSRTHGSADCAAPIRHGTGGHVLGSRPPPSSTLAAYLAGFRATWTSVFSYVLFGTYIGIGALAHDFGFSVCWAFACTC